MTKSFPRDYIAGLVVFLVALPLCLGVALASKASPMSGLIAGIVGGVVVGLISRSATSVSGPAAGLTAVVAAQITSLGSFNAFLVAVVLAGVIQIGFGIFRLGFLSGFFPNCVIKGLLAAIGVILILKQFPHLLGHDADVEGEMSFQQPDGKNTFTELIETAFDIDVGASVIGLVCLALLLGWDRVKSLKSSLIPAPLVVVLVGSTLGVIFGQFVPSWALDPKHLVAIPVPLTLTGPASVFTFPDFTALANSKIYLAAATIAIVASLETLLNVEAVDKIDPLKRNTPTSRELIAQGVGNVTSGMLGGLPVTSVIVRSSVNILAGGRTKVSAVFHGVLLAVCIATVPNLLNRIPLSCLAAILIVTGFKLVNWKLLKLMWGQGWTQFLPFVVTVVAIVLTDLLIGILIGLGVSIAFILASNFRRPLWRVLEKHVGGDVLHIHLASQVSFLNRGALTKAFESIAPGQHVLIDARDTDYIDPDILDMIREFEQERAPVQNIRVSLLGFRQHYEQVEDKILYADFTSRELRDTLTPAGVLQILRDGNERFASGTRISRDLNRQMAATSSGQFPIAAVLSCIDSRAPVELLFDVGLGDVFTCRIAGNVAKDKVLGSLEYAAVVAGVKLIVVMGHTKCGAVTAAVEFAAKGVRAVDVTTCDHLDALTDEIRKSVDVAAARASLDGPPEAKAAYADEVARLNVRAVIDTILGRSNCIRQRVESGEIEVVGCLYDISTGKVAFDIS
jgi:MFS superfamily sulfate permease-like transporter